MEVDESFGSNCNSSMLFVRSKGIKFSPKCLSTMEVFKFAASTLDTGIDEISQNSALWISGQKEPSKQAMM